MQHQDVLSKSRFHLGWLLHILHAKALPSMTRPQNVRQSTKKHSYVVFLGSSDPFIQAFIVQHLGLIPIVSFLLLLLEKFTHLLDPRFFLLRRVWLLLLRNLSAEI